MKTYENFNSKLGYFVQVNLPNDYFNNGNCDSFLSFLNNTPGKIIIDYDDGYNLGIEYPIVYVKHHTCVKYYMYFSPDTDSYYKIIGIDKIINMDRDKFVIEEYIKIKQKQEKFNL